jgi:hypothetical protein
LQKDIWLFQMLAARLITSLGIWFSPSLYSTFPILVPFAVRDPHARGNKTRDLPDQWGSPNKDGLFRDDNSLVKNSPRSLIVKSDGNHLYDGRRLGNGFVACHVWRGSARHGLATRHPLTYSFVPNLVWLPEQVANLTDRPGSFAQTFLQALSLKIYGDILVPRSLRMIVKAAWERLPRPHTLPPRQALPDVNGLNFFQPTARFIERRKDTLLTIIHALDARVSGSEPRSKIVSSRYTVGLRRMPVRTAKELRCGLVDYARAVRAI